MLFTWKKTTDSFKKFCILAMEWPQCTLISPKQNRDGPQGFQGQVSCQNPTTLLRTKGFCGARGDATARCVNLYADMVTAC